MNPVLEPLRAPPVDRRHLLSAYQHREMQVVPAGEPRHAAPANLCPFFDFVTDFDPDRRQVTVERLDTKAMIDDHAVTVDAQV